MPTERGYKAITSCTLGWVLTKGRMLISALQGDKTRHFTGLVIVWFCFLVGEGESAWYLQTMSIYMYGMTKRLYIIHKSVSNAGVSIIE